MSYYKKKPIPVLCHQWHGNGDHPDDAVWRLFEDTGKVPSTPREGLVVRYFRRPDVPGESTCKHCGRIMHDHGWIDTLEGGHVVCPGDWIITGVNGERYPCKPDIFAKTYEPASTPPAPAAVTDELAAFKDAYSQLDLLMTKDAWGRDCFYHPHVQSLWDGWKARAALQPPTAKEMER